jgi:hypothetical protein
MEWINLRGHGLRPEKGGDGKIPGGGHSAYCTAGHSKDHVVYQKDGKSRKKARHHVHSKPHIAEGNHTEDFSQEGVEGIPAVVGDAQRKCGSREFTAVAQIYYRGRGEEIDA